MGSDLFIDLRSDTVTKPTKEMLEVMFNAEVGDDVFDEDPTVKRLEEKSAALFGKEAGLFVPSGTMANQIAIRLNTQQQQEVICDKLSHIYYYEGGGTFSNSGVSMRLLDGDRGRINAELIKENINDLKSVYLPESALVSIENTCNKGGGSFYTCKDIAEISKTCLENNLKFHIDGARIFNALTETNESPISYSKFADTISFCFSKGLGAPIGSMLLSTKENIFKAKRIRKAFGGGMRQVGYLAAAGIYALDNNVQRLKEDHFRASELGKALSETQWVSSILPVESNIVVFSISKKLDVKKITNEFLQAGIGIVPFGAQDLRMVTHLDIDDSQLDKVISTIQKIRT